MVAGREGELKGDGRKLKTPLGTPRRDNPKGSMDSLACLPSGPRE